ncbi:ParB/RepB/Spo0J family partition protein [Kamptonema cortianum]|nr:ParB/RepB/Spo0J family partition protein [Geitlerinema splendidum]MDK3160387.1 ParB/RepB/Spo0J family partition protein [Kamptonema cortianum]
MRRALGKGLSQLLGETSENQVTSVPVADISANHRQPRVRFDDDALQDLAASIRQHGVLQPLVVRPAKEGKYELIAGERRLRASQLAGLQEVPVVVRAASAQTSLELALIENIQREDISAMECAVAYQALVSEFNMSQEEIGKQVGKSRAAIANTLRLLKLPEEIQEAILEGSLSEGHARALLMVESPVKQMTLFRRVQETGMSVREVERLAKSSDSSPKSGLSTSKKKKQTRINAIDSALEQALSEHFGSPVRITRSGKGGEVSIQFYADDDLQRILDILEVEID